MCSRKRGHLRQGAAWVAHHFISTKFLLAGPLTILSRAWNLFFANLELHGWPACLFWNFLGNPFYWLCSFLLQIGPHVFWLLLLMFKQYVVGFSCISRQCQNNTWWGRALEVSRQLNDSFATICQLYVAHHHGDSLLLFSVFVEVVKFLIDIVSFCLLFQLQCAKSIKPIRLIRGLGARLLWGVIWECATSIACMDVCTTRSNCTQDGGHCSLRNAIRHTVDKFYKTWLPDCIRYITVEVMQCHGITCVLCQLVTVLYGRLCVVVSPCTCPCLSLSFYLFASLIFLSLLRSLPHVPVLQLYLQNS